MLKRIYVDDFRCLVNFDLRLDELTLLLGLNGGGKSSAFDVLTRLRRFLAGLRRSKTPSIRPRDSSWTTGRLLREAEVKR